MPVINRLPGCIQPAVCRCLPTSLTGSLKIDRESVIHPPIILIGLYRATHLLTFILETHASIRLELRRFAQQDHGWLVLCLDIKQTQSQFVCLYLPIAGACKA